MWQGFDPRAEPLETEILKEWTQDGVALQILRYRIGVFKGKKAWMAGVYGFPEGENQLPGLQIHGGGQYADYKAPLTNAKRDMPLYQLPGPDEYQHLNTGSLQAK